MLSQVRPVKFFLYAQHMKTAPEDRKLYVDRMKMRLDLPPSLKCHGIHSLWHDSSSSILIHPGVAFKDVLASQSLISQLNMQNEQHNFGILLDQARRQLYILGDEDHLLKYNYIKPIERPVFVASPLAMYHCFLTIPAGSHILASEYLTYDHDSITVNIDHSAENFSLSAEITSHDNQYSDIQRNQFAQYLRAHLKNEIEDEEYNADSDYIITLIARGCSLEIVLNPPAPLLLKMRALIFDHKMTTSIKYLSGYQFIDTMLGFRSLVEKTVNTFLQIPEIRKMGIENSPITLVPPKLDPSIITIANSLEGLGPNAAYFTDVKAKDLNDEAHADIFEVSKPEIRFEDIGGQVDALKKARNLSLAINRPDSFKKWAAKPPKGILFYGPPGTGKTLIAKALASECNAIFIHVRLAEIVSKWFGESETKIQNIFLEASARAKSEKKKVILYFDEMDSLAPKRETSHEASQRIVSTLLTNIDGMESDDNIIIVGSTNMPESIDKAMLRPGRLNELVHVPLPDKNGREQIFKLHSQKNEISVNRTLFNEGWLSEEILNNTEGYSGADIAEILRRALFEKAVQEAEGQDTSSVSSQDILEEISKFERNKKDEKKFGFRVD